MIADSSKKKFDAVIMYTLDRFARNRYDSAIYKSMLKKNGVKIFYAKQPMPDSPESIILEAVLEGYAEYYSANLARGIKNGMKENALKCFVNGTPPLGYKIGADKKHEIDPVGAKAVQSMFEMYSAGKSAAEITEWLNEKGYKTSRGNPFNKNSLGRILRNDIYVGTYRYDDVVVEGGVPAIIDKKLFEKTQARLHRNYASRARNKAKDDYLLTTKVFCGNCRSPMIGESGTSRNGTLHHYYKCADRKRGGNCKKKIEKKDWLERTVVEFTVKKVLTDKNIEKIATKGMALIEKEFSDHSLLREYQEQLKDVEKRIDNIMKAIEEGILTPTTKQRLTELDNTKQEIEVKIAREEMKKPPVTKERIMYWLYSFKDGDINDIEYQRRIIDTLLNSVYVYDGDDGSRTLVFVFNISGENTYTLTCSDIDNISPPNVEYPNTPTREIRTPDFFVGLCFGYVVKFEDVD